jgi:MoxR-like ATPase
MSNNNKDLLNKLLVKDLHSICKKNNIEKYYTLRKAELIEKVLNTLPKEDIEKILITMGIKKGDSTSTISKKSPASSDSKEKQKKEKEIPIEPPSESNTQQIFEILNKSPYRNNIGIDYSKLNKLPLSQIFKKNLITSAQQKIDIIVKGQYSRALELLAEADASDLHPILVGPPGVGKTTLCRYYAQLRGNISGNKSFEWITFDEATKPAHLLGSFNPAITIQKGFKFEAFNAGPLLKAMFRGGVFLANEINRATEYTQNSLLEPLEERTTSIPHLGRIKATSGFFFIGAMNPSELVGTHHLGEALKDRFNVWIELGYPNKKTEMEIIEHNNPYYTISESLLEKIYLIINRLRNHHQVQTPASLRSGIAMARLAGLIQAKNKSLNPNQVLRKIAKEILIGSIKPKPGIKTEPIIKSVLSQVIGSS